MEEQVILKLDTYDKLKQQIAQLELENEQYKHQSKVVLEKNTDLADCLGRLLINTYKGIIREKSFDFRSDPSKDVYHRQNIENHIYSYYEEDLIKPENVIAYYNKENKEEENNENI